MSPVTGSRKSSSSHAESTLVLARTTSAGWACELVATAACARQNVISEIFAAQLRCRLLRIRRLSLLFVGSSGHICNRMVRYRCFQTLSLDFKLTAPRCRHSGRRRQLRRRTACPTPCQVPARSSSPAARGRSAPPCARGRMRPAGRRPKPLPQGLTSQALWLMRQNPDRGIVVSGCQHLETLLQAHVFWR